MHLLSILALLAFATAACGQTLTVTGPTDTLYCGYVYAISWTSTALVSTTPLTIELWNNNPGLPDSRIATITTDAQNNGTYKWLIPTNDDTVLGIDEMYFYIYVTGDSSINSQGVDTTISHATVSAFTPGGGQVARGSPVNLQWTYSAPTIGTVTITLARNTSPITTIGTIVSGQPLTAAYSWTPSIELAPSNDYYIFITLEQDNTVRSASSEFTIAAPSTSTVTTVGGAVTVGSTQGATVGATTGGTNDVVWSGSYAVQSGCDISTCCCLSDIVTVTENGLNVAFSGSLRGQCDGATTLQASATLTSLSSNTASFTLFDNSFQATRSGDGISVANLDAPQCSGSAVCSGGACKASSAADSAAAPLLTLLIITFGTLAFM